MCGFICASGGFLFLVLWFGVRGGFWWSCCVLVVGVECFGVVVWLDIVWVLFSYLVVGGFVICYLLFG